MNEWMDGWMDGWMEEMNKFDQSIIKTFVLSTMFRRIRRECYDYRDKKMSWLKIETFDI